MWEKIINVKFVQKILIFFERKSIFTLFFVYLVFAIILLISDLLFNIDSPFHKFINDFGAYLTKNNSDLITIATVFIGIYFTIYTLLISFDKDYSFNKLSYKNKKTLIKIMNWGFLSSFSYVIYSLIYSHIYFENPLLASLIIIGILLLFLYSALVFGVVIYILARIDIEKILKE